MASPSESLPETVAAPSGPMTAKLRAATPPSTVETDADGLWSRQSQLSFVIYWSVHAGCLAALFLGVGAVEITTCLGLFWLRMFGITGGYHRYFSHRTYKTGRVFQFVLALLGCMSAQKGPLWWAAGHRRHHKYSDEPGDMHSPRAGIWYSHQAWIFDDQWGETELDRIPDFARYPELVWLNRWHVVPPPCSPLGSTPRAEHHCWSGASVFRRRCSGTRPTRSIRSHICSGRSVTTRVTTAATTSGLRY